MFPKEGNKLHFVEAESEIARKLAEALHFELGSTHQAVKTLMRWTNASERSVKHWLAATHVPSVVHLIGLARHSDQVLRVFLVAAGRREVLETLELGAVRAKLQDALKLLDSIS